MSHDRSGVNIAAKVTSVSLEHTTEILACLPLFADQEIALQPGTSFELNGTRVRCLGSDTNTPKCRVSRVSQAALDYYNLYVGSSRWGVVLGFDNAVKTVVELKQAGVCS